MNLIIDQGNTNTKLAIFEENRLLSEKMFSSKNVSAIERYIESDTTSCTQVFISSVIHTALKISGKKVLHFDKKTDIPLQNRYTTPETLGKDRLANAVAVWTKNPSKNSLCIDIGTCIKYDIVNSEGAYLGGNISPGLHMRYSALQHFTGRLPLIQPSKKSIDYGKSTETSIQAGVQLGIQHEIMGFIRRYSEQLEGLTIFMTGGDLNYFDIEYKNPIFADSSLTLFGLNEILTHNT